MAVIDLDHGRGLDQPGHDQQPAQDQDQLSLGVDVGATKLLACLTTADGSVVEETEVPTPGSAAAIADSIAAVGADLAGQRPLVGAGLSIAGWVDRDRQRVTFSPHIDFRGEPLASMIAEQLGVPAVLENDANAAAWAEFRFGSGRDSDGDMAFITIGSGVGSGFVVNGKLVRGGNGMAGELGHLRFRAEGPSCPCGRNGCYDMYGSGRGLGRAYEEVSGRSVSGTEISELIMAGDTQALQALTMISDAIGWAAAETVMMLDPSIVVLGGGVARLGEPLRTRIEQAMRAALGPNVDPARTRVLLAETGSRAGAIGAADLGRLG